MAALGMINIAARDLLFDPTAKFLFVVYLIGAPGTFFGSIGLAHNPMKQARDELLSRISDRFMLEYGAVRSKLEGKIEDLRSLRERIDELKKLYDVAADFPVWPFDATNLRRFFGALSTPLVPVIISITSDFATKWLKGLLGVTGVR
jgi:hypothetical protein